MTCFLDMDGVLTDFVGAACAIHGASVPDPWPIGAWDVAPLLDMNASAFWKPLQHDFWATMPWTDDGKEILAECERRYGQQNIVLLTSPCASPYSASGKIAWIQRFMNPYRRQYALCPCKQFMARSDAILIDDSIKNCKHFIACGGYAKLVTRPWNQEDEELDRWS